MRHRHIKLSDKKKVVKITIEVDGEISTFLCNDFLLIRNDLNDERKMHYDTNTNNDLRLGYMVYPLIEKLSQGYDER